MIPGPFPLLVKGEITDIDSSVWRRSTSGIGGGGSLMLLNMLESATVSKQTKNGYSRQRVKQGYLSKCYDKLTDGGLISDRKHLADRCFTDL